MAKQKVFGIGFQKTGTAWLGVIFDKLGYSTLSYAVWLEVDAAKDTP